MISEPRTNPSPSPLRVLVVDDDALVGAIIGEALKAFRVTFAQSATGALGRIEAGGDFRAIVCDFLMPGVSGFEFHAKLELMAPDLARRVVFLSGLAGSPEVEAFVRRTGVRCLPKPVDPRKLEAAVIEATQR